MTTRSLRCAIAAENSSVPSTSVLAYRQTRVRGASTKLWVMWASHLCCRTRGLRRPFDAQEGGPTFPKRAQPTRSHDASLTLRSVPQEVACVAERPLASALRPLLAALRRWRAAVFGLGAQDEGQCDQRSPAESLTNPPYGHERCQCAGSASAEEKTRMTDCPICRDSAEPGWVCAEHPDKPWQHVGCEDAEARACVCNPEHAVVCVQVYAETRDRNDEPMH